MPLLRSDFDQTIRYLKGASAILQRAGLSTLGMRNALEVMVQRLSPGDQKVTELAGHIAVMLGIAHRAREAKQMDAATEIMKAVAVLRDKSH